MHQHRLTQWLERLGYTAEAEALHRAGDEIPAQHQYALEMQALLRPDGAIRAEAVFDVEGVPTVAFFESADGQPYTEEALDNLRQRLWNQNLVSVVIAIDGSRARALPVRRLRGAQEELQLQTSSEDGHFSAAEIRSSAISDRLPKWFDVKSRVDRKLLENISIAIVSIAKQGMSEQHAQVLMGQVLFVSYLEHRQIVSDVYRTERGVGSLHALVARSDCNSIVNLIERLRKDFNGDFLAHGDEQDLDPITPWHTLTDEGFHVLNQFLSRVDLATGQGSLWNYDFSFIPVELLSGLYESFLTSKEQEAAGAYYTPRHLATLAVHQAFMESPDPLSETIFDGACGSGILLTTAYRRLIALHEARAGRQLGFGERGEILKRQIFGGDINPMACRVTAFSLYLSLMEGLDPADILLAQARDGVKLPTLRNSNLYAGERGDFFSTSHPLASYKFSLAISNPPWVELKGKPTSADLWANGSGASAPLRQMAGYYALRAIQFLGDEGRLCLILPIALLMGAGSEAYLRQLFAKMRPRRLFNFGDLQQLIFPTAENSCHLLLGERRPAGDQGRPGLVETFDYIVPKAELSLNLGRLSVTSADRHALQTRSVAESPEILTTYMWGDAHDLAVLARLQAHGTFGEFWRGGAKARWVARKGIHFEDVHRKAVSAKDLAPLPFAPLEALKRGVPVLHRETLGEWPARQKTVVGLNAALMRVFDGPRILFPDGFSREELNVRAVFADGPITFNSSVGVIAGPQADADLLRFAAVYLRSKLARYFLMLTNTKMLTDRNGVHLKHVEPFPFFPPEAAPNPAAALVAMKAIVARSKTIEDLPVEAQREAYLGMLDELDQQVFDYFGVGSDERQSVLEAVDVLMPSIRPRAHKSLYTPRQRPASSKDVRGYAASLGQALTGWRDRLGGTGAFNVEVVSEHTNQPGGLGVVRIQYLPKGVGDAIVSTSIDDALTVEALKALRRERLSEQDDSSGVRWVLDQRVWTPRGLYLAKALTRHAWLVRTAQRDAEAIVRDVQARAITPKAAA